jgi:hypothetical protein
VTHVVRQLEGMLKLAHFQGQVKHLNFLKSKDHELKLVEFV